LLNGGAQLAPWLSWTAFCPTPPENPRNSWLPAAQSHGFSTSCDLSLRCFVRLRGSLKCIPVPDEFLTICSWKVPNQGFVFDLGEVHFFSRIKMQCNGVQLGFSYSVTLVAGCTSPVAQSTRSRSPFSPSPSSSSCGSGFLHPAVPPFGARVPSLVLCFFHLVTKSGKRIPPVTPSFFAFFFFELSEHLLRFLFFFPRSRGPCDYHFFFFSETV